MLFVTVSKFGGFEESVTLEDKEALCSGWSFVQPKFCRRQSRAGGGAVLARRAGGALGGGGRGAGAGAAPARRPGRARRRTTHAAPCGAAPRNAHTGHHHDRFH
ncbi:unnamed protein product [Spodoptera exigua]|nr:unnamed protein product [Spodoptera exigua]